MWPFKKKAPFTSDLPPGPVSIPKAVIVTQEELYEECFTRWDYVSPDQLQVIKPDRVIRHVGNWRTTELWMEIDDKSSRTTGG